MATRIENGWVIDERNNRANIALWGGEERAAEILKSLVNCSGCSDCSHCSDCSECLDCLDCLDCLRCLDMAAQKISEQIPVIFDIHKKLFDAVSKPNALDMSSWHGDHDVNEAGEYCGTTHCRAGWVVALAGKAGRDLEQKTSTLFAAQQIYKASGYPISPCRFFDDKESAMADMKRLAESS